MDFSWFESIIFGFVMGLGQILPVSAQAHRAIMLKMFGSTTEGPLLSLMINMAVILAVYFSCAEQLHLISREARLARIPRRRRKRQPLMQRVLDMRLMRMAFVLIAVSFFFYPRLQDWRSDLSKIAIFLVLNGLTQYIPMFLPGGNKDSRTMTRIDALWMGFFGGLAVIPGLSRTGGLISVATVRGADPTHAVNWAVMLTIPALAVMIGFDAFGIFTTGIGAFGLLVLLRYLLTAAAAYVGTYLAIRMMRVFATSTGFSGFAYYSWGAALFSLILYLSIS